jgi:hypothetical protein
VLTIQQGEDNPNRKARTGQPERDSQNGTACTGQPVRDSRYGTAGTGQPERDSQKRIFRTGHPGRERKNRTSRTGLMEQDCKVPAQDFQDMTAKTGGQSRTAGIRQPVLYSRNKTARTGQPEKSSQECEDRTERLWDLKSAFTVVWQRKGKARIRAFSFALRVFAFLLLDFLFSLFGCALASKESVKKARPPTSLIHIFREPYPPPF